MLDVVCLCAEWCSACRAWRPDWDALAAEVHAAFRACLQAPIDHAALNDWRDLSRLVESQSLHDLETGLYSRAFMIEMLAREVIRMTRARRSLTFAVVSPCHLDSIEQQFGSEARQIATTAFVEVLQAFRKGSDTASRIGPDSFALVLPEMDIPQADKRVAAR